MFDVNMEYTTKLIAVVGSFGAMIYCLHSIFDRIKEKKQGIGNNTLKAIGVALLVPSLLILAIVTDFKTETLAALFGTVAGLCSFK